MPDSKETKLIKKIKKLSNYIYTTYGTPLAISRYIDDNGNIKAFIKKKIKFINNKIRRLEDDLKKFKKADNNGDLQEIINKQKLEIKDFVNIKALLLEYLTMQKNGMNKMKDEIYNIKNRKPKYPNIIKPVLYKGAIKRQQNIFDDRAKRNKQFDFSDDKKIKRKDRRDYSGLKKEHFNLDSEMSKEQYDELKKLKIKNKKQLLSFEENNKYIEYLIKSNFS